MLNAKSIILAILNIIDYQDDRNQFANEFVDLCCRKALNGCLAEVPKDRLDILNKELMSIKDLDGTVAQILKYIPKETYEKHLKNTSRDTLISYINTILPTISPEQEEKLRKYLHDLGKAKL